MSFVNWRYQQFEGTYVPVLITDEPQTIEFHTDWNAYGIQLSEVPQKATPSTLSIEEVGTGTPTTFTEVPFNQAPGAGEFRVDYETTNQFGTGRIQFNGADDGKQVLVTYYGLGSIVSPDNFATVLAGETIPGALTVSGLLTATTLAAGATALSSTLAVTGESTFTGGFKTEGSVLIKMKKIAIGTWDMDATSTLNIAHGLSDTSKVLGMFAVIVDDSADKVRMINVIDTSTGLAQGNISILGSGSPGNVTLARMTGGLFDNTDYNSTGVDRGNIFIVYMV